jgi:hypothetical protein
VLTCSLHYKELFTIVEQEGKSSHHWKNEEFGNEAVLLNQLRLGNILDIILKLATMVGKLMGG